MDISQLSDDQLQTIASQPAAPPTNDLSAMSDDDLHAIANPPPPENPHDRLTFLKNTAQGLWNGAKDVAGGAANAVMHPGDTLGDVRDWVTSGTGPGAGSNALFGERAVRAMPVVGNLYDKVQTELDPNYPSQVAGEDKDFAAQHPTLDKAQRLAGNSTGMAAGGLPGAALYLVDAYQRSRAAGNDAETALKDASNVGMLMGGIAGLGKVAGVARDAVAASGAGDALKSAAEEKAFKAAVGNQAKPYNDAVGRGVVNARGRELLDSGTVGFGDSAQQIADKAAVQKQLAWNKMQGILAQGDEQITPGPQKVDVGDSIPIGDDHSLVLQRATPGKLKDGPTSSDKWVLVSNDAPDKPLGDGFHITQYDAPKGSYGTVSQADIGEAAGQGLGPKVYKALSDQYGTLVSDANSTSPEAKSVWNKIGGQDVPDSRFEGTGDLTQNGMGWQRQMIEGKPASGGVSGQQIADAIRATRDKIAGKGNASTVDALNDAADHYESMGENVPFTQAQIEKNSWQYKPGADFKVNNIVKGAIGDAMESGINDIGLGDDYQTAKSQYGTNAAAVKDAQVNANRYAKNNAASLGDKAAAAAAMAINPHGTVFKAVGGAVAGGLNKLIRKRGNSAAAVTMDSLGDILNANPQAFGKFAAPLQAAASRGPQSLAVAHYVMSQSDPDYQKFMQNQGTNDDD